MFVRAGGRRLEYRLVDGAPGRPTLVLLHEGLGSVSTWRDFPDALAARTQCPVLAYSRWGHGASEPLASPRGVRFMHDEALRVLPELLDTLRIERPILVGHSDGGSIAIIHAGARVRPVRGLALLAPHVFVEDLTIASITAVRDSFAASGLRDRLRRHHGDNTDGAFHGWADVWLDPAFRAWSIEPYLPAITCPVLVIQGEGDEYGTKRQLDAIASRVAGGVETMMLPRCGHAPHREQPEVVLEAIRAFVAST